MEAITEPITETAIEPKYSTTEVAQQLGIQNRQAQNVIRSVLGEKTRYRITQSELKRVQDWHAKNSKPRTH